MGDFLLGALLLREPEPVPFSELGASAAESGLRLSPALAWISAAEDRGIVERVGRIARPPGTREGRRGLRLTPAGSGVARGNRRRVPERRLAGV